MPFNGTGTFTRDYNWQNDAANAIPITASRFDDQDDDFAEGLSTCMTKDGQTLPTSNLPMNSHKFTGLGNGSARTDSIALGQVQDGTYTYLGTTGGSADEYTATPVPAITAYVSTMRFRAKINATNLTTTPYFQISGIANPASTAVIKKLDTSKAEIAVEVSDLLENGIYEFQRNSANTAWILINPEKIYINGGNISQATESAKGGAEIVTLAEMNAGTDDSRMVTTSKLKNSVFNSKELISTATASNTAVIDFTNLSNQYSQYIIEVINVLPANDNVYLSCRFSTDNGSSFITSGYIGGKTIGSNLDNPTGSTSNTDRLDITPNNAGFGVDNASTNGIDATLVLSNPSSTTAYKSLNDRGCYDNDSGNYTYFVGGGRYEGATTAINAIRFLFSAGNIASGTFKLYGVK